MTRKIIISKNTTAFYFLKKEFKLLRAELDKTSVLSNYTLTWCVNRFIIKFRLTDQEKSDIMKIFSGIKEPKKQKQKIIRGHKGCLITGFGFQWK